MEESSKQHNNEHPKWETYFYVLEMVTFALSANVGLKLLKAMIILLWMAKAVAYVDDLLTCGAKILPKQDHVVGISQGENYSKNTNSSSFLAQGLTLYSGQYQLVNNSNNQPYSNVKYIVIYADGHTIEGVTDENGMTEKLELTEKAEDIEIKLFEADSW